MRIIDSVPFKIAAVATAITAVGVVAFAVRSINEPPPPAPVVRTIDRQPEPPPQLEHPVEIQTAPHPAPPA